MSRFTPIESSKYLLKPFDVYISSKVICEDVWDNKRKVEIELFTENQIKWFNQQTADDLYDYFLEVIDNKKYEVDYLCSASTIRDKEREMSEKYGKNFSILSSEEDENPYNANHNEWLDYGYTNNYGHAVYIELQRVLDEYDQKNSSDELTLPQNQSFKQSFEKRGL